MKVALQATNGGNKLSKLSKFLKNNDAWNVEFLSLGVLYLSFCKLVAKLVKHNALL